MFNFDKEKKIQILESENYEETVGKKCLKKQLRDIFLFSEYNMNLLLISLELF